MKKINSIWYGTRILTICGLFLVVIPVISYLLYTTFLRTYILITIIRVSVIIGAAILLLFGIILAIELQQDRRINLKYNHIKYSKMQINAEVFECQNCGSRKVGREDTFCRECSIRFSKQ